MFIPCKNKNRSLRLQKKLHLGPFREEGFNLSINFIGNVSSFQKDTIFMEFIINCIEPNGMLLGGCYEFCFIVRDNETCTKEDQEIIRKYLTNLSSVLEFEIGELVDAWYV